MSKVNMVVNTAATALLRLASTYKMHSTSCTHASRDGTPRGPCRPSAHCCSKTHCVAGGCSTRAVLEEDGGWGTHTKMHAKHA